MADSFILLAYGSGRATVKQLRYATKSGGRLSVTGTSLRITVIGIGYLGLTHAVCMADLGHQVLAIDVDREKLARAAAGEVPFFEPGLEPLLRKNLEAGRASVHGLVRRGG